MSLAISRIAEQLSFFACWDPQTLSPTLKTSIIVEQKSNQLDMEHTLYCVNLVNARPEPSFIQYISTIIGLLLLSIRFWRRRREIAKDVLCCVSHTTHYLN